MRAKEVVMSNKEGSKGDSAIDNIKAVRRLHMIFVSSIEAFDELFKRSKLFGFLIEVLESDNLMVLNIWIVV